MSGLPAVSVRALSKRFGAYVALDSLDFEVPHGSMVAIIGPNGGGKTTLLQILLGLMNADSGEALVLGHKPGKIPAEDLGYIPQVKLLDRSFPAIALELVLTGIIRRWPWRIGSSLRGQALEAMKRIGVEHLADKDIATLSGGELQRVYLARSLARRPKILMLDEPGAGMDIASGHEMYHILEKYQRESGATVLMITHDWEGARVHASHALLLSQKVLAFGPAMEVVRQEELLRMFGHVGHIQDSHEGLKP